LNLKNELLVITLLSNPEFLRVLSQIENSSNSDSKSKSALKAISTLKSAIHEELKADGISDLILKEGAAKNALKLDLCNEINSFENLGLFKKFMASKRKSNCFISRVLKALSKSRFDNDSSLKELLKLLKKSLSQEDLTSIIAVIRSIEKDTNPSSERVEFLFTQIVLLKKKKKIMNLITFHF